ncbi:MAG: nuclear transport factor 2 family protein [Caenibius sp.]
MSTRETIQTYMDKMNTGDFLGAFQMFSDDGAYTIIGDTPVSGTYVGPDHITSSLVPLLEKRFVAPPVVVCTGIIVEGNRGVALGHGEGPAKFGQYKQRNYAFAFTIDNGKVKELIEFMDPNQLSANCFGQALSEVQPA